MALRFAPAQRGGHTVDTVTARERLEEMRGQIDRSILVLQGEHPSGRAATDSPQDPADAGARLSETDRTEAALEAVQSQRRLVMDALVRIDRGVYGTCADCGKAIPEGRLDARPEAARCVGCQSKRDRRY
jgi:RNA polymerase-binding transcription factor